MFQKNELEFNGVMDVINFFKAEIDDEMSLETVFDLWLKFRKIIEVEHDHILQFIDDCQIFTLQYYRTALKTNAVITIYLDLCENYISPNVDDYTGFPQIQPD